MAVNKSPKWVDFDRVKPKYIRCDSCKRPVTLKVVKKNGACPVCGSRQMRLPCRTTFLERVTIFLFRR